MLTYQKRILLAKRYRNEAKRYRNASYRCWQEKKWVPLIGNPVFVATLCTYRYSSPPSRCFPSKLCVSVFSSFVLHACWEHSSKQNILIRYGGSSSLVWKTVSRWILNLTSAFLWQGKLIVGPLNTVDNVCIGAWCVKWSEKLPIMGYKTGEYESL